MPWLAGTVPRNILITVLLNEAVRYLLSSNCESVCRQLRELLGTQMLVVMLGGRVHSFSLLTLK